MRGLCFMRGDISKGRSRPVLAAVLCLGLTALASPALALDGDGYPSVYGPAKPTPLPNTPGRGVWSPSALSSSFAGTSTTQLYLYLQKEEPGKRPDRSAETPGLLTAQQQEAEQRALKAARDGHDQAMQERLQRDRR
jgi:hypothetical protein